MPSSVDRTAPGLQRDLALLEALAADTGLAVAGLGVSRLAEVVQRDKGQVSRALRVLEHEGLVERDSQTREYHLGWRLYALAARSAESRLLQLASPLIQQLATQLDEAAHLCVPQGSEVLTLLSHTPPHSPRMGWEGRSVPTTCTSAGRVLLLDASLGELRARFRPADFLPRGPRHKIHNADDLFAEIAAVREHGFAIVDEEFEADLVGASAPIRDFRGRVVAAVNVSAAKSQLGDQLVAAGQAVARTAGQISLQLGYRTASSGRSAVAGWHKPS